MSESEIICVEFINYGQFQQFKLQEHLSNDLKPGCDSNCQHAYHEDDHGYSECLNEDDLNCPTFNSDVQEQYHYIMNPMENV